MSTGAALDLRMRRSTSKPSQPGSVTSRMIASQRSASALSTPAGPVYAALITAARQNLSNAHPGTFDEFLVVSDNPRLYWAGAYLQNLALPAPGSPPRYAALVFVSGTLRAGGLFFDDMPWSVLSGGLLLISILLWIPFVRRLTRGLTDMTRAAERLTLRRVVETRSRRVRLSVSDEGPSAPEATLNQLFDPFFRPEAARPRETGGTGLGLAIVKSCVEACGGTVSASNRTSSSLAVTFTLRRAPDQAV